MLTRILFCSLWLISTLTTFSQNDVTPELHSGSLWSTAYFAGPLMSFEDETGYEVSFETAYHESDLKEFIFNLTAGKIPRNGLSYTSLIEVSIGPRFLLGKKKLFFAEGTFGAAVESRTKTYIDYYFYQQYSSSTTKASFYMAAGFGGRLLIGVANSFLYRLKFQTHLPYSEGTTHITGQFGIQFSDHEAPDNRNQRKSKLSFSLAGGINNPLTQRYLEPVGGYSAGIEAAFKSSPKVEWSISAMYNEYRLNGSSYEGVAEITTGPRFFMSRNSLTSFFELGGGIYVSIYNNKLAKYDRLQPGIYLGTGILGRITDHLGLFVKGKMSMVFTENPDFPFYTNLLGGVRYNL